MDIKLLLGVFIVIFIAELGDKTQLATMLFAADKEVNKFTVFIGASLALILESSIGVLAGSFISEYISEKYLHYIAGLGFVVVPDRHAATLVLTEALDLDIGIEYPALGAGHRVQRDDAVKIGAEHQRLPGLDGGQQGRRVQAVEGEELRRNFLVFAGPVTPGKFQFPDVRAIDLVQRGVTHAARVATVGDPVGGRRRTGIDLATGRRQQRH